MTKWKMIAICALLAGASMIALGQALPSAPGAPAPQPQQSNELVPAAQPICSMQLGLQATPLLNGHLTVHVPALAKVVGDSGTNPDQTQIRIESGDQVMLLVAKELYDSSGPEFDKKIREASGADHDVQPLRLTGLRGLAVAPKAINTSVQAPLIGGAYTVLDSDGTVQSVGIYMTAAAAKDPACIGWGKSIVQSLAAGTTKLDSSAGLRKIPLDAKTDLVVTVPPGVVLSLQKGPDFTLYRLRDLKPYGVPRGNIGIYVGDHPSEQYKVAGLDDSKITATKGTLLGKDAIWKQWTSAQGASTVQVSEAVEPVPIAGDANLQVHVFVASSTTDMTDLKKIVDTMQVQPH